MDKVLAILFHPVVELILAGVLGIVIAGFKKYKKLYSELMDVGQKYNAVTSAKSPGGKTITDKEWIELGKEVVEVLQSVVPLFKKKSP